VSRESNFKFQLGDKVRITASAEPGEIIGRVGTSTTWATVGAIEFTNAINSYHVRYLAGDGRAVESWWQEDAIEHQR
jgi:hypothetical protein